jgi:LysM repeat protein
VVPATNVAPVTGGVVYVVQQGDTLSALANRFGVTADQIAAANHLTLNAPIVIAQRLAIPAVGSSTPVSNDVPAVST